MKKIGRLLSKQHLAHHPNEAWKWAEVQFDGDMDRASRMLHLHRALQSTSATINFIKSFVDAFPKAVRSRDSYFLRYPLHFACAHSPYPDLIKYLIDRNKVVVSCGDIFDRTPLHYACFGRAHEYGVHFLLDIFPGGAQCADVQGWLPLHVAARYGCSKSTIHRIVRAYPNALTAFSRKGMTPFDLANHFKTIHDESIIDMLQLRPSDFLRRRSSTFGEEGAATWYIWGRLTPLLLDHRQ
jgi:hypothetical protein